VDGIMRNVYQPNTPNAVHARLHALEARITSLLIQLADTRQERDRLLAQVNLLQSSRDSEGWRQP
jgi:hypothetical protein